MLETTYLHIGLDKTGSTAIQVACDQNRRTLSELGILYPAGGVDSGMHAQFASCFYDDPQTYYFNLASGRSRLNPDDVRVEDVGYLENVELQIKRASAKTMVISYEGFMYLDERPLQKMRSFLDRVSNATKVIVYFRDPMSYAASAVSQRAKSGVPLWDEVPHQKWQRICETFGNVFGVDNLIVRKFSRDSLPNGDVRLDFFNQIGLSSQAVDELVLSDDQDNTSLSMEAILIGDSLRKIGASEDLSEGEFFATYARILEGIRGSKFQLSAKQAADVRLASKAHLDYVDKTFGIKFEVGKAKSVHPKVVSLGEEFVQSTAQCLYELTKANPAAASSAIAEAAISKTVAQRPNYAAPQFVLHPDNPNKNTSVERGQAATVKIDFLLTRGIPELEVTLHILDSNGRLAFGIGNGQLGQTYSDIMPGSYRASYYVLVDLPPGKYTIGFSVNERNGDKYTELAWFGRYCELDVHDAMAVKAYGYASLPAEISFSPTREAKEGIVVVRAKGSITISEALPMFHIGEIKTLGVTINNQSEVCWIGDVFRPVKLSYHWLKQNKEMHDFEGARTVLPAGGVRPGQSLGAEMKVVAPNEAGVYILVLTLLQEEVGWFEKMGLETTSIEVNVNLAG